MVITVQKGRRGAGAAGSGQAAWYVAAALLVLAVLAGGVYAAFALKGDPIDEATLCPATGPTGELAVLLDLTDPLQPAQADQLRARLDAEIAAMPVGSLIAIGLVHPDQDVRGQGFALCRPLEGERANQIYQNPTLVAERYAQSFRAPLETALATMLSMGSADSSPIMESLQSLLARADAPSSPDAPRRLIIVSDLLQHSEAFSFYRGQEWDDFQSSREFARLARNLEAFDVRLYRIPRSTARIRDPSAVDDFWVRYFDRQGAASVGVPVVLGDL